MNNLRQTWPMSAFDAINIKAGGCKIVLQGTDENLVTLEGDVNENNRNYRLIESGRWLNIFIPHDHSSKISLKLPTSKAWVTEIFAGKADIEARNIRARLQIMLGDGNINIEEHTGKLVIVSGHNNFHLNHFIRSEVPETPAMPQQKPESENRSARNWLRWDETEWQRWGEGLGEKIGWWAMDFSRLFDGSNIDVRNADISIQTGNGNVELAEIEAKTGLLRISNGNLKLQQVYVDNLDTILSHGNVDGKSLVPSGNWAIKSSHGNVRFSLASNVSARLDMATRNGDIHSEIPLVRVTRQGPETNHGKRMVGSIGPTAEGNLPEIRIVANHGNIDIDSRSPESQPAARLDNITFQPPAPEALVEAPVTAATAAATATAVAAPVKEAEIVNPEKPTEQPLEANTPQAILEALSKRKISVTEAEQLLKSMSL
jgi:hypothetical protein